MPRTSPRGIQNGGRDDLLQPPTRLTAAASTTHGMGWPYYAEELWLGTPDGGAMRFALFGEQRKGQGGRWCRQGCFRLKRSPITRFRDAVCVQDECSSRRCGVSALFARAKLVYDGGPWKLTVRAMPLAVPAKPDSYLVIRDRTWKTGDIVTLHLPMKLEVKNLGQETRSRFSVDRGAV